MPAFGQATPPSLRELRKLQEPTVTVEYAGRCFRMGRTQSYDSVRKGNFPVQVIRRGRSIVVPTAALLRVLDLEPAEPSRKAG
jgi:hypothetical protein